MAERKRHLFAGLEGTVVEIGAGTGLNLAYMPRCVRYVAVEPNVYMHRYLRAAADEHRIDLDLQPLTFETFEPGAAPVDAVVCTLVLCSVDDPAAVVAKALRMLRPGGRFMFVEHVGALRGTWLRAVQRAVRPLWRFVDDGCEPDRETATTIGGAGFASLSFERFCAPVPVVSPHIAGIGEKG